MIYSQQTVGSSLCDHIIEAVDATAAVLRPSANRVNVTTAPTAALPCMQYSMEKRGLDLVLVYHEVAK